MKGMISAVERLFMIVVLIAVLFVAPACSQEMSWSIVDRMIERDFPGVPTTDTARLSEWLDDSDRSTTVLLDVRTEEEYAVSHLKGAIRVDPDDPDLDAILTLPRDTPLVAYCSVGYRSAALVRQLQDAGFSEAHNLRGSIFAWANEDRPVYRDSARVWDVHPYDRLWGRLLVDTLRTRVPRERSG